MLPTAPQARIKPNLTSFFNVNAYVQRRSAITGTAMACSMSITC